jgi:hypothetical protein
LTIFIKKERDNLTHSFHGLIWSDPASEQLWLKSSENKTDWALQFLRERHWLNHLNVQHVFR